MKDRKNAIKAYLRQDQRGKEANHLEQEALSDPFLYEALEGLTMVEGKHLEAIKRLDVRMSRIGIHGGRRIGNYWWIAAAFFIVAGVAWKLLYTPMDEPVKLVAVPQIVKDTVAADVEKRECGQLDSLCGFVVAEKVSEAKVLSVPKLKTVRNASVDYSDSLSDLEKTLVDTGHFLPKTSVKSTKKICPVESGNDVILLKSHKARSLLQKAEIAKIRGGKTFETRDSWRVAFERYVADSLHYPEDAALEGVRGSVVLSLNFNRRGKLSRIKIIRKLHPACDREAVRLVKEYSGSWGVNEKNVMVTLSFY